MEVLLITSSNLLSEYGGGQIYIKNLIQEFNRCKINPMIAAPLTSKNNIETYHGCKVVYFNSTLNIQNAISLLEKIRPRIVHAHGYKAVFAAACNRLNIPCIVTAHHGGILCPAGTLLNHKDEICRIKANHKNCLPCVLKNIRGGYYAWPILRVVPKNVRLRIGRLLQNLPFIIYFTPVLSATISIQKKFEEWEILLENAHLIIAPSYGMADCLLRNGLEEGKLKVLPHGIPLPKNIMHKKIFITSERSPVKFFYVGRMCHVKGIHVLLAAFKKIKGNIELHLVGGAGNSSEERYLKVLQRKYKNDGRIYWHSKADHSKVYSLINDFDILINHHLKSQFVFYLQEMKYYLCLLIHYIVSKKECYLV
jgi:glycosyltransferase involved in cell wall biosynthesis